MPQIMIDTSTASVPELREAARFLEACAKLRDGTDTNPLQLLPDAVANGIAKPVPAPPAPTAPLVVVDSNTQALPAGTVYDSAGMPWDERIHQSGKGQKKGGEWKLKKGIDLSIVEAVTKDLVARMAVTKSAADAVEADRQFGQPHHGHGDNDYADFGTPQVPTVPVSLPAAPPPPPPPTPVVSAPAAVAPTPVIATAPVAAAPTSYRAFLSKVVASTKANKVTQEEVTAIVTRHGAPSIAMLNSLPHLIPAVEHDLDMMLVERA